MLSSLGGLDVAGQPTKPVTIGAMPTTTNTAITMSMAVMTIITT